MSEKIIFYQISGFIGDFMFKRISFVKFGNFWKKKAKISTNLSFSKKRQYSIIPAVLIGSIRSVRTRDQSGIGTNPESRPF